MTTPIRGAALALAVLLLAGTACKGKKVETQQTVEETAKPKPQLASAVRMNDRNAAAQLVTGFHDIENGAWRWTARQFAVNLHPPAQAAQQGAVLEFHLTVPAASIKTLGSITLSATVAGSALAPETYSKAGDYTYRREVPAAALAGDLAKVEFQLDKAMPPNDVDKRELGVVAAGVALVAR